MSLRFAESLKSAYLLLVNLGWDEFFILKSKLFYSKNVYIPKTRYLPVGHPVPGCFCIQAAMRRSAGKHVEGGQLRAEEGMIRDERGTLGDEVGTGPDRAAADPYHKGRRQAEAGIGQAEEIDEAEEGSNEAEEETD